MNRTLFLNQKKSTIVHTLCDYEDSIGDETNKIEFPNHFNQAQWLNQLCTVFDEKSCHYQLIIEQIRQQIQQINIQDSENNQTNGYYSVQSISYNYVKSNENIDLVSIIMILYSMDEGVLLGYQRELHEIFCTLIQLLEQTCKTQIIMFFLNIILTTLSSLTASDVFLTKFYINQQDMDIFISIYMQNLQVAQFEIAYTTLIILSNIYGAKSSRVNYIIEQSINFIVDNYDDVIQYFKYHHFRQLISEICDTYMLNFNENSIALLRLTCNLIFKNTTYENNQLSICLKYINENTIQLYAQIVDENVTFTVNQVVQQYYDGIITNIDNMNFDVHQNYIQIVTFNIQQFADFYLCKVRNKSIFYQCIDFMKQKLLYSLTKQQVIEVYQILFKSRIFQTTNSVRFKHILSIINIEILNQVQIEQIITHIIQLQTLQNILIMTQQWKVAFDISGPEFKQNVFRQILERLNAQQFYDVEFVSQHLLHFTDIILDEPTCLADFLNNAESLVATTSESMPYYEQLCQYMGYNQ